MKNLNFKKGFLTFVALMLALVANATIGDIQEAGFKPAGAAFGGSNGESVSVDFETEAIKAVVDLSTCQSHVEGTVTTPETILSFGAKITALNYSMSGGVIHLFYYADSKELEVNWNCSSQYTEKTLYVGKKTLDDTNVTIELSKAQGLTINGKVWGADEKTSGTSENLGATALLSDGNYTMSILNLSSLFVGSAYGEHSNATYTTLAVISADEISGGGTTEPEEPESADTVLAEDFTADGTGFKYVTAIDWDKQYVSISVDVNSQNTSNIISIGAEGKSGDWNDALHSYWTTYTGGGQVNWYPGDGHGDTRVNNTSYSGGTMLITLSKDSGYVVDGVQKFAPENLSAIFALSTIELSDAEGGVRSSYHYNWIKLVAIPEEVITPDTLTLPVSNYTAVETHEYKFTATADPIDFTTQKVKAVVDLSSCTEAGEEILTIGQNTDKRDANWVRLTYAPESTALTAEARVNYSGTTYATLGPVTVTVADPSNVTIELGPQGLVIDGTVAEGEDPYGEDMGTGAATIKMDADNMAAILGLTKVEINSIYGEVRSHATYKSIEVTTAEEQPEEVKPEAIPVPLTESYTPNEAHNNQYIGTTNIDWDKQTLSVTLEITNATSFSTESLISIGEDIASKNGAAAGNIHIGVNPGFSMISANYLNNTQDEYVASGNPTYGSPITFELSKANGLTAQVGTADATTVISATDLAPLFTATTIQIGSVPAAELGWAAATSQVNSITLTDIETPEEPVSKPEGIPFDLTEKGGWDANGDTFAWDSDIDWDKQALEVVLDLSNCTASNENILSIAGSEADLATWWATDEPGHIHFYYTKSSSNMEVDYLSTSSNATNGYLYRNSSKSLFSGTGDNTIVIGKDGVKVNDTLWEGTSEQGSYTALDDATIEPLTSLSHIWVGSTQGDNRSKANYKSIRLITATGISNVETENAQFNVYNISGQMVQKNASSLNALPKGIYIVNGKKVVKK